MKALKERIRRWFNEGDGEITVAALVGMGLVILVRAIVI